MIGFCNCPDVKWIPHPVDGPCNIGPCIDCKELIRWSEEE